LSSEFVGETIANQHLTTLRCAEHLFPETVKLPPPFVNAIDLDTTRSAVTRLMFDDALERDHRSAADLGRQLFSEESRRRDDVIGVT